MYSLGVIFFEMCFAFKTNMERVHILNALRQPSITFPPAWPKDAKPKEREIVEWLLRHDPNMRPKAEQLLASPLLPAREKQKEFYDNAIPGMQLVVMEGNKLMSRIDQSSFESLWYSVEDAL